MYSSANVTMRDEIAKLSIDQDDTDMLTTESQIAAITQTLAIEHFASVREVVSPCGEGASGSRLTIEVRGEGDFEAGGATYRFVYDDAGRAAITSCASTERSLTLPGEIEGRTVVEIGPHAFSTCYSLQHVELPSSLEAIGPYAFMNTALSSVELPASVRSVGNNAFYKCEHLAAIRLNEGLVTIGEEAFRDSGLERIVVPASVSSLGRNAFQGTATVHGGSNSLVIAEDSPCYFLEGGALYQRTESGIMLAQLLNEEVCEYQSIDGLTEVGQLACADCSNLRRVVLADGVRAIGERAFKSCKALESVELPDSVRSIGRGAFRETSLKALRIPSALEDLGTAALYTGGSNTKSFRPTIQSIEVPPENDRFFLEEEALCQRMPDGDVIALLYIGHSDCIRLPEQATLIGPYAYLNTGPVREVFIHDRIRAIDVSGLDFGHAAQMVVYGKLDGERFVAEHTIHYPAGRAGRQATLLTFSRGFFDVQYAYTTADNAILTTQDTYTRSRAMLERLANPTLLEDDARSLFEDRLKHTVAVTAVEFGRNGFLQGIDMLADQGFLNEGTIDQAIEACMDAGELAALSRLMELKRATFAAPLFDFDL